jgi:Fur family ferric uptake transcriptional regulator
MWEETLTQAGCRITLPRRVVMEVLAHTEMPLSPQEIFEQGKGLYLRLGLVTVYRTLELFEAFDLVRRVHREDGCHGYLLASPGHRHVVICQECGRAVEFAGQDDLEALVAQVESKTGYRVESHLLQLFGCCPDCRQK